MFDDVGSRNPRERRHQHFITGLETERRSSDVQRRRAARGRRRVGHAREVAELFFELAHVASLHDPAAFERLEYECEIVFVEDRFGDGNLAHDFPGVMRRVGHVR